MPQYMLLIYADEAKMPTPGSPEQAASHAAWMSISDEMRVAALLGAGDGLQPIATATTVRVRDGERVVTDGPFAETREMLAGYYLLDTPDLDAALDWAARLPNAPHGSVEVRPVMNSGA
jgi:hypothetical protein